MIRLRGDMREMRYEDEKNAEKQERTEKQLLLSPV